ncbi:MAG: hypothetical protein WC772_03475 [Candidatus Margulisiibacteriota bacterium]
MIPLKFRFAAYDTHKWQKLADDVQALNQAVHLMAKTPGAPSPGPAMRDHKGSYFGEWEGAKNF